jgi:hypothetical protein
MMMVQSAMSDARRRPGWMRPAAAAAAAAAPGAFGPSDVPLPPRETVAR